MTTANNECRAWIQTYTGQKFFFTRPNPDSINIIDIARSLSRIPRYNGHTEKFYSVAEHSVAASLICDSLDKSKSKIALLHDAAEAYIGDIASPLKKLLGPKIIEIESRIQTAVFKKFGIKEKEIPEVVKQIDLCLLETERLAMFKTFLPWETTEGVSPFKGVPRFYFWTPDQAEIEFIKRFEIVE